MRTESALFFRLLLMAWGVSIKAATLEEALSKFRQNNGGEDEFRQENLSSPALAVDAFAATPFIKRIAITHGDLVEVEAGAFNNLTALKVVDLRANRIKEVRRGVFERLHVVRIYLEDNAIAYVHSTAFNGLPYLEELRLSRNRLNHLLPGEFRDCPSLRALLLDDNELREVPREAFAGAFLNAQPGEASVLRLSRNAIDRIHPRAFAELWVLEELDLGGNLLEAFDGGLFANFTHVGRVVLSDNRLREVPEEVFGKNVGEFDLTGNWLDGASLAACRKWALDFEKTCSVDLD